MVLCDFRTREPEDFMHSPARKRVPGDDDTHIYQQVSLQYSTSLSWAMKNSASIRWGGDSLRLAGQQRVSNAVSSALTSGLIVYPVGVMSSQTTTRNRTRTYTDSKPFRRLKRWWWQEEEMRWPFCPATPGVPGTQHVALTPLHSGGTQHSSCVVLTLVTLRNLAGTNASQSDNTTILSLI